MAHVLVYPDGMRRYSSLRSVSLDSAYYLGGLRLKLAAQWLLLHCHFQTATFHCLALYNQRRSHEELQPLVDNGIRTLVSLLDAGWIRRHNISLRVIGALDQLADQFPDVTQLLRFAQQRRYRYQVQTLNILAAYGGIWDLEQAMQACEVSGKSTSFQHIAQFLKFNCPVDLIVRSGQRYRQVRLSDTLLQAEQAQMFGFPTLWPEVRKVQVVRIYNQWESLIKQ